MIRSQTITMENGALNVPNNPIIPLLKEME